MLWCVGTKREELLHKEDCKRMQIIRMKQSTGIEPDLCGLCFSVCPYTQRYLRRKPDMRIKKWMCVTGCLFGRPVTAGYGPPLAASLQLGALFCLFPLSLVPTWKWYQTNRIFSHKGDDARFFASSPLSYFPQSNGSYSRESTFCLLSVEFCGIISPFLNIILIFYVYIIKINFRGR